MKDLSHAPFAWCEQQVLNEGSGLERMMPKVEMQCLLVQFLPRKASIRRFE